MKIGELKIQVLGFSHWIYFILDFKHFSSLLNNIKNADRGLE